MPQTRQVSDVVRTKRIFTEGEILSRVAGAPADVSVAPAEEWVKVPALLFIADVLGDYSDQTGAAFG